MTKSLRIGFMGTPDFALAALQALCESNHEIVCVYSQPPRPKGRGHKTHSSPVHIFAEKNNISVFTPLNFKSVETIEEFRGHNLDVAVVAAYGLILPQDILDAPRYGCINIHASLLPRWRGASPIQHAIWKGDVQTGIGLMQMELGLDTGSVIAEERLPITQDTTAQSLHDELAALGGIMIVKCISDLSARKVRLLSTPQTAGKTYAPLLSKDDGRINWTQDSSEIDCQIRALNPWPGVWSVNSDKRIKILKAQVIDGIANEPAGVLINKRGHVACGNKTILWLETLQPEGKNPMDFVSALNGGYINIGEQLT